MEYPAPRRNLIAFRVAAQSFFGDANAWIDWFHFTQGMNGGSLVRTLEQGNLSPVMLLAQRTMAFGIIQYALLVSAWMALAFVLAVTSVGRRTNDLVPAMRRCLEDPWLALSIGVMFTFATAPLVWAYYHVFALIPMFAFFRLRASISGARCIDRDSRAYLGMTNPLLARSWVAQGFVPLIPIIMFWAWVPLLMVVLSECADRSLATAGSRVQTPTRE